MWVAPFYRRDRFVVVRTISGFKLPVRLRFVILTKDIEGFFNSSSLDRPGRRLTNGNGEKENKREREKETLREKESDEHVWEILDEDIWPSRDVRCYRKKDIE